MPKVSSCQEFVLHDEADGKSLRDYKEEIMWSDLHFQEFPGLGTH